ncbi:protein of unknown function [Aminobacter niigataensis]|nr:protein of unknown function [Aminobacter niigataensis]
MTPARSRPCARCSGRQSSGACEAGSGLSGPRSPSLVDAIQQTPLGAGWMDQAKAVTASARRRRQPILREREI